MGRIKVFAGRVFKEIVREPLSLILGAGLPLILLFMFSIFDIPNEIYALRSLAPAIIIFGFSFLTMSLAILVSKDRSGAFLTRLYSSPMRPGEFMAGYCLPMAPVALMQAALFFTAAVIMGMEVRAENVLVTFAMLIVPACFYIVCGMLFGTAFSDRALGGPFTIFINLSTWLSGTWFPVDAMGKVMKTICDILPFAHCVSMSRCALAGSFRDALGHLAVVLAWTAAVSVLAAAVFGRKSRSE